MPPRRCVSFAWAWNRLKVYPDPHRMSFRSPGFVLEVEAPPKLAFATRSGLTERGVTLRPRLSYICRDLSVPVTAKIRALEKDEDTLELVKRLEGAGAQLLTGGVGFGSPQAPVFVDPYLWHPTSVARTSLSWGVLPEDVGQVNRSSCTVDSPLM